MFSVTSRKTLIWFPLAVLLNGFSMTALLVITGLAGHYEYAASIGLVQASTVATFNSFSANARNLILAEEGDPAASRLLQMRLILLVPLACVAYFLSVSIGHVAPFLASILILRRVAEWFGELGLCQHERLDQQRYAQRAVFVEILGFLLCLILSLGFGADFATSTIPWAFSPLISLLDAQLTRSTSKRFTFLSVIPHTGSTAIIGVCVYVFRISVAVLVGKDVAGELFTAFAIGGVIPTLFGQVLAPTLLRRFGSSVIRSGWLTILPIAMLLVAGVVITLVVTEPTLLHNVNHKQQVFWLATGFSIAGGAVMVFSALLRANVIHCQRDDQDVFGPDLLCNILLVLAIPLLYFTLGSTSMAGLYLLSASLNLIYIWGVACRSCADITHQRSVFLVIGLLLVTPVFFQLQGRLFDDSSMFFDTGNQLLNLPIPVSALALFGGIAVLANYNVAKRSLTLVFFTMMLCLVSVLGMEAREAQIGSRLVLLSQFIFPMFGLVLGEMFGGSKSEPNFERVVLWMLLLILPAQLVATWISGQVYVRPSVFIFSIYQHIQYFPMIVAALATMASFTLWGQSKSMRVAIGIMIPTVLLHLEASGSTNAIVAAVTGIAASCAFHWYFKQYRWLFLTVITIGALIAAFYALLLSADNSTPHSHGGLWSEEVSVPNPPGLASDKLAMIEHWRIFTAGVTESPGAFIFGHVTRPDRNLHPSAHNYWLDMAYSFGMISILPLLIFLALVSHSVWKQRKQVLRYPVLLGATIAVAYLTLVESMFDIGMRQIYPGIITFFILGILSARLRTAKCEV